MKKSNKNLKKAIRFGGILWWKKMITKEEFEAYESVRKMGVTNMFNVPLVMQLSGLLKEQIMTIMKDYDVLSKKYLGD